MQKMFWIVGLDVHHEMEQIFSNDKSVFTFSMHVNLIILQKTNGDLDVGLDDNVKMKNILINLRKIFYC